MKMQRIYRRTMMAAVAFASLCGGHSAFALDDFPSRPIKIVIPLPAGGAADTNVRAMATELTKLIKQPVIIENKPGGLFQIGVQAVLSAPADGHTVLFMYSGMVSTQAVQKRFDLARDFDPIAAFGETSTVLAVAGNGKFKTTRDLIDFGRANPGKLSYSTLGAGSQEDLKSYEFVKAADLSAVAIPYKGGPDAVKALLGNEVDFIITPAIFALQFAPKGQMQVLAAMDSARLSSMPKVPTIKEAGVDVPPFRFWSSFLVKAGTPDSVTQKLAKLFADSLAKPSVAANLAATGATPSPGGNPEAVRQRIAAEAASFSELAKQLKLQPN